MKKLPLLAVGVLGLLAVGCGDSDESAATTVSSQAAAPSTSAAPDSSVANTSPDATTVPSTTAPDVSTTVAESTPTTDAPSTTTPATTPATTAPTLAGWSLSDFSPAAFVVGYSGNWEGPTSPPAPASPAESPADGYYIGTLLEPWVPGDTSLQIRVQRLEYCTELPDGCPIYDEGSNELNLDPSWTLDLDVPLDATSTVVLSGFSCWDDADEQTKQATGAELGDLFAAFAADYDAAIRPSLEAGVPNYEVADAVAAAPTGGFVGETAHCGDDGEYGVAGPLRYIHDDAPVLLLQTVTSWDTGDEPLPLDPTDLIALQGVDYRDGVPTFYFYAGFYS